MKEPLTPISMKKEIIKQIEEATDFQLIIWIQDINRRGGDEKYSEDFKKAVHNEICKRGDKTPYIKYEKN